MASLTLYSGSLDSSPYVLPCFDLDFMTAFNNRSHNNWDFFNGRHIWSLSDPWIGFAVAFDPSFAVDDVRYDLLEGISGAFPFPNPQWRYNGDTYVDLDPSAYDTFDVTSDTLEPDDWETNYLSYFGYVSSGDLRKTYRLTSKNMTWAKFRSMITGSYYNHKAYRMKSPCGRLFISHGGLHDFTFGVRTTVAYSSQPLGAGVNNWIVTGMVGDEFLGSTNVGETGSNPFAFTDINTGKQLFNAYVAGRSSGGTTNQGSRRVQTYPVAFTVPKGTILPAGSSGYPAITFAQDTQMLGIMCVRFNAYGTPEKCSVCVMSKNMWAAKSATSGAGAGSDTVPTGGKGKQTTSKYDPRKTIAKNTSGGILIDPTTSAGFVIYRFTPSEFSEFLSKVYTETALPTIPRSVIGIGSTAWEQQYDVNVPTSVGGWSNTENIVFVKTSPIAFPVTYKALSKLSIGVLGIPDVAAAVVTDYLWTPNDVTVKVPNDPQWFTDVEPYANCQMFFPLAGAVSLPPSVLAGSTLTIKRAYNLLNNGCDYSVFVDKGNSDFMYFAKNGECAKSADCVIPGRDISGAVGSFAALAATGIATLATGGVTAPALLTSAFGAATTAVHDSLDLNVTNMPPSSSSSPYDDTVYGGLRDIVLYRAKAERFTSGESDVSNPLRSKIIGTASGFYVDKLSDIKSGSFVSCHDFYLKDTDGMTRAEADKIIAYVKEGVYI